MRTMLGTLLTLAIAVGYCGIAGAAGKKAEPKEKKPPAAFTKLDTDNDGKISLEEFTANKKDKAKEKAEAQFRKYDTDMSGDLSLEEFKLKGKEPKTRDSRDSAEPKARK